MRDYFRLHFRIFNRKIVEFGLPPFIVYLLLLPIFIIASNHLFNNTEFAEFIFLGISLFLLTRLNERKRNNFLKVAYNNRSFVKIRIYENLLLSSPFVVFLIFNERFFSAIILLLTSLLLSIFIFKPYLNYSIPTPFSKKPFEFTIGFRKTFFLFPLIYYLTYISISVRNFNLGVFSLLAIGMVCFSYYLKSENPFFIWIFSTNPKEFLIKKIRTVLLYFTLLCAPILVSLLIFYTAKFDFVLLVYLTCSMFLILVVLAKYAALPGSIHIPQVVLIIVAFMFPPILLFITPFFYSTAVKRLKLILK